MAAMASAAGLEESGLLEFPVSEKELECKYVKHYILPGRALIVLSRAKNWKQVTYLREALPNVQDWLTETGSPLASFKERI